MLIPSGWTYFITATFVDDNCIPLIINRSILSQVQDNACEQAVIKLLFFVTLSFHKVKRFLLETGQRFKETIQTKSSLLNFWGLKLIGASICLRSVDQIEEEVGKVLKYLIKNGVSFH